MPQVQLPIFPVGATAINAQLAFERRQEQVVYFNGHLPVFTHEAKDLASFRLFTTQLVINGTASQGEIVKAFGVPITTVKRCCKRYRQDGAGAFFKPPPRRQGTRLTDEVLAQVQKLLDEGLSVPAISAQLNILATTLHKAIDDGRLKQVKKRAARSQRRTEQQQEPAQRGRSRSAPGSGQPFFAVTQAADPGMLKVLEEQIVPRLLTEVPAQPTAQELAANRHRARLTMIFDRAGYSPEFFARRWEQRIAIITYHKFPEGQWAEGEFAPEKVRLVNGEEVELALAERGVCLSNGFWVREVRHRDETGHQTAMISTDYLRPMTGVAVALFARWSQENFFQYMGQHYGLDRLIEYGTEPLPETTVVVNPAWRKKDQEVRRERARLVGQQAQFGAINMPAQAQPEAVADYEQKKGQLLEQIQAREKKIEQLKTERKETPRHLALKDLPQAERFSQLRTTKKHFVDTIKLIAYRAETALVALAREKLSRPDDARALVRQIFESAVNLCPNPADKTLTVRLHRLSSAIHDQALEHLCAELTATETVYPGTELRLIFQPVGTNTIPRGQES